jgi:hypothetical protein
MAQKNSSGAIFGTTSSVDLAHGQIVIVAARWILVIVGLALALWAPDAIGQLRVQILVLLALAVANFYLHAQVLMRRPAIDMVTYAASAADIAVITSIILVEGGFDSNIYVFYFPAILAFSVAFPTVMTALYTVGATFLYAVICLGSLAFNDTFEADSQVLITRLLMLVAIAVCGNQYWRIERERRQAAAKLQEALVEKVRERRPAPEGSPGQR